MWGGQGITDPRWRIARWLLTLALCALPFAFGALRTMGVPVLPALIVHGVIALGAAAVTWAAWRRNLTTKVPIVAAASLLVSPYLLGHDSVLMMVPIGWLIVNQRRTAIVVLLWAISILAVAAVGPNPTPIAAIIAIVVMWQEAAQPDPVSEARIPASAAAF